jgi:hypothetical protein
VTEGEVVSDPGPPTNHESDITSLEVISIEAPFGRPARLDLKWLMAIASAERNEKEDHLWALREDPSYFAYIM